MTVKYIPRGVGIFPGSEWEYTEEIGVRETTGSCAAIVELTQNYTDPAGEVTEQAMELSLGQAATLRDVLDDLVKRNS